MSDLYICPMVDTDQCRKALSCNHREPHKLNYGGPCNGSCGSKQIKCIRYSGEKPKGINIHEVI